MTAISSIPANWYVAIGATTTDALIIASNLSKQTIILRNDSANKMYLSIFYNDTTSTASTWNGIPLLPWEGFIIDKHLWDIFSNSVRIAWIASSWSSNLSYTIL